jgi:thermolysin
VIATFFLNAFYAGNGVMCYGVGLPAGFFTSSPLGDQTWDFVSGALDIVAHELTHGVTEFSSNLIYMNESGALDEAFSDMMATGAEFFFQPAGSGQMQADYSIGEDVIRPGGLRSLANPRLFGDPDHYSRRFRGPEDNGGVHTNSLIASHAYYLAIEGGTNHTSGLSVQGVGAANREQIEKIFYRGFTQLLPSAATFSVARAATLQAARDLYGAGSAAERAVAQAWTAVGVE